MYQLEETRVGFLEITYKLIQIAGFGMRNPRHDDIRLINKQTNFKEKMWIFGVVLLEKVEATPHSECHIPNYFKNG